MTILDTLKSLLGLESRDRRPETDEDVGVTVEREPGEDPDASTERSVKGVNETETREAVTAEGTVTEETAGVGDEDTTQASGEAEETEAADPTDEVTEAEETAEAEDLEETEAIEDAEETGDGDTGSGTGESTDVLEGIGPAYADRLADAGVETVADLAAADASSLAEEADVSESRLERWIERAKNR